MLLNVPRNLRRNSTLPILSSQYQSVSMPVPGALLLTGDCRFWLQQLPANSVQCLITSPPYFGLRSYGLPPSIWGGDPVCDHRWGESLPGFHPGQVEQTKWKRADAAGKAGNFPAGRLCTSCGAWLGTLGLEPTPALYTAHLVEIFGHAQRVLKPDGTFWLDIGDSYWSNPGGQNGNTGNVSKRAITANQQVGRVNRTQTKVPGLKSKDLIGIPWMMAFALREAGWYLRAENIWCLSGGTFVYARTHKGEGPIRVSELTKLRIGTVSLWNGQRWTKLLGLSMSQRKGDELEIVLRSGERISCTPTHRFPTQRGLLSASELRAGDCLERCILPEPITPKDGALDCDAAWFAGLYLAEGSMSKETIQIAGHIKEEGRWARVQAIAKKYGGSATRTIFGNKMDIRVYGRFLRSIIDEFVAGRTAKDKHFSSVVWRYSNSFVSSMLDGYLSGDSEHEPKNNRWRLGFCRNYDLERSLRIACARLGYTITLNLSYARLNGTLFPSFHGEIRKERSGHWNEKSREEVVAIQKARCPVVYDLGVEDDPHLFALASGVLTHNSKPNGLPQSMQDRPTRNHEHVFLFTKRARYTYYKNAETLPARIHSGLAGQWKRTNSNRGQVIPNQQYGTHRPDRELTVQQETKNLRSTSPLDDDEGLSELWWINTKGFRGAHFAVMPEKLAERCLLLGSQPGDIVLDPFSGSGTVGAVALKHGRRYIGLDQNPAYNSLAAARLLGVV